MEKSRGLMKIIIIGSLVAFTAAQWTPDPTCPYPSDVPTRYPYYGNCSLFWECYQGAKYVMECPEGLEFNADKSQCDDPTIANCDPFVTTSPFTTRPPTSPNTDTSSDSTDSTISSTESTGSTGSWTPDPMCPYPSNTVVYFPYEGDCTKYWECWQGNKYEYQCSDNLWWNQALSVCDYPENVDCEYGNSTTSSSSPDTTTTPRTTTPSTSTTQGDTDPRCADGNTSYWPHPSDCSKYIQCFKGNSYEMDCPPGLYFSEETEMCGAADESKCCSTTGGCNLSLIKWLLKFV